VCLNKEEVKLFAETSFAVTNISQTGCTFGRSHNEIVRDFQTMIIRFACTLKVTEVEYRFNNGFI
jgi:hypothetical protein